MWIKKLFNQSSDDRIKIITEGELRKSFLIIALPGILTILIRSVTPLLDGLIIYRFDNEIGGAAISYANSLSNILIMGIFALGVGGSAIIGNYNGTGDKKKALDYSGQLLSLVVCVSLISIPLIMALSFFLTQGLDEDLKIKIVQYINLTAIAVPFYTIQVVYTSIKSVFGHPEIALMRAIIFVPLKLFFSFLYIAILKLGVVGAGLSSFSAYVIVAIFIIYEIFFKESDEKLELSQLKPQKNAYIKLLTKSWPIVIQDSLKSLSFFLIRFELVRYGALALAAGGIASDINMLFTSFVSCFTSAIIAFVSVNIGAGKRERARQSSVFAIQLGTIIAIVSTVICIAFCKEIVALYNPTQEVAEQAIIATKYYASSFIGFSIMFNIGPALNALGLNKASMIIQLLRIWIVRLAVLYLLYFLFEDIGFIAVYISLSVANNVGGLVSYIYYKRINWKTIKSNV
ncbi:MAG: MATE family efflux transporter [Lachnospirales bacterium]